MGIPGLTIIGETINDSVPSTHELLEKNDIEGIVELAKMQAEKGAAYIDVNVGSYSPKLMVELVKKIQEQVSTPLSIDSPDPILAAAGLTAYNPEKAGNQMPILNSISEARLEMFDIYSIQPFIPILLITEGMDYSSGEIIMNKSPEQIYATAKSMVNITREKIKGITNNKIILDPGIMPIGSDSKGDLKRLFNAMKLIHEDRDFAGINMSVGLSNFTAMLPSKKIRRVSRKKSVRKCFLNYGNAFGFKYNYRIC